MQAEEGGNEIDDNVPTAEGVRPRGPDDVCEGTISVEVPAPCALPISVSSWSLQYSMLCGGGYSWRVL